MIKLDMEKAFDRLNHSCIISVLENFGFSKCFRDLTQNCLDDCWFSLIINGELNGYFPSSRGVRQGDPFSPALFIIAEELLSRSLLKLFNDDKETKYHIPNFQFLPSLLFADDCIIFTRGKQQTLQKLMNILDLYEEASGQRVKNSKSALFAPQKFTRKLLNSYQILHNMQNPAFQ